LDGEGNPGDTAGWVVLHRVAGPRVLAALLGPYTSAQRVFDAGRPDLLSLLDGDPEALAAVREAAATAPAEAEREWLDRPGNHIVTLCDPAYPPLLRQIPDPPPLLFVRGDPALLAAPQLAVVGSRNPTPGGTDNARAFARALARAGLAVTSGLALGIDAAAHEGALEVAGRTLAVAGTGLDRVYPASHRALAHAIAAGGALISEFPLGTPPRRENFPQRNRIISGLALGVLVVEAAPASGSLITARLAAEQGREVFAIPGSIHSPLARGCHALIRQGAKLVETAQDILEELGPLAQAAAGAESPAGHPPAATSPAEEALLVQLGHDPADVDTLCARAGLTPDAVSSMLLQMELRGLVASCPGGKYQRRS
jgi:DNA processing protein